MIEEMAKDRNNVESRVKEAYEKAQALQDKLNAGAKVVDSVIQPGAKIGEGAKVTRCIVADNVEVAPGAVLGSSKSEHIDLVAKKYAE